MRLQKEKCTDRLSAACQHTHNPFSVSNGGNSQTYGPNLKKLGTHPRNIHRIPSLAYTSLNTPTTPCAVPSVADITLVLTTSIGLVTVAATTPAKKLAAKCVAVPSPMPTLPTKTRLNTS